MTTPELLTPLLWAGATHLAMWTAGSWLRAKLAPSTLLGEAPSQRAFLSAMLGFAMLGTGAFILGSLRLLVPPLLAGAVAVLAIVGIVRVVRAPVIFPTPTLSDVPMMTCVAFVLAHLPKALYPVLEHDENVYHLLIPKLDLAGHRLVALPWSLGANMPHLVDLSYVFPTALGGFTAAKVFVLGFILWTLVGLASFGRELLGPIGPGVLAALYLSGRVVQWHLGLAYVEPVIGAVMLAALASLRSWWEDHDSGRLYVMAVLLGAACASKYTVWPLAFVIFTIVAAVRAPSGRRAGVRTLLIMTAIVGAIVLPWLVKDAIVTGNPIFPNLPGVFQSPYWSPLQGIQFQHEMGYGRGAERGALRYLSLPLRLVTDRYTGDLGTASFSATFMLLFLAAMFFPWRRGEFRTSLRALSAAGFAFWCLGSKQGRYLVAWLPVMIVTAGLALAPLRRFRGALATATVVIAAVAVGQVRWQPFPVEPVMDVFTQPRSDLLARNLCWQLTDFLNRTVPPEGRVFSFWENRLYFLERPFVTDSAYGAPTTLARLREAGDPHAFAQTLAAEGFTHVVINPYHYKTYMANQYLYSLIDERFYTEAMLRADNALLDRFINEELELVPWDGGWAVCLLRAAAPPH